MLNKSKSLSRILLIMIFILSLATCSSGGDSTSAPSTAANPTLDVNAIKTFHFSWDDVSDATHYKLMENADGISGFVQVGSDIPQGNQSIDHVVPLYARLNGQYILQTCNNIGCTDSTPITISDTLVDAIGYFKASNTGANDFFGISVGLSADGSTLAVGAFHEDSNTTGVGSTSVDDTTAVNSGAVYVFVHTGTTWTEQAYIKASNAGADDLFGIAVSLSADGNTLSVGALNEDSITTGIGSIPNDDGTANDSGAVYVFVRTGSNWSEQAYIKVSNTGAFDWFGRAVSLSADGNTLAVGAINEDSNTTGVNSIPNDDSTATSSGAVYVFTRIDTTWTEQAYIKASNTEISDLFGYAVTLSGDGNFLVVGATNERSNSTGVGSTPNDDGTAIQSGAVYIFSRTVSTWVEQAYVKASNTGALDGFGYAVSLSTDGNTLAVSAYHEDSNTTGVDSIPNDDGAATSSGAVYVFSRIGTTWTEQAYIKASNTDEGDWFGSSVSLSADGNTLAVGAINEGSNTTGVGSIPNDEAVSGQYGAVYVFTRTDINWVEQSYIKASNTDTFDQFGISICLSGDGNTLAVSAYYEDSNTTGVGSIPNDDGLADLSGAVYLY